MRRHTTSHSLTVALVLCALLLTGCAPTGPKWVDSGASYTDKTVASIYSAADITALTGVSTSDATQRRHDALLALRKLGGSASDAADLITKTLPADTRGVPVYIERAQFNGQPSLVVAEATGPASGKLTTKRLWVLSAKGAVLYVGTR